ncbi:hypothetical protein [Paenibacillus monticola]|uniref:DUF4878 domain-containing protein n=1 Tax=Paenibacillus monticola TaxID=2666075 RepID=A0A7X2H9R6_9BACL|nr:hypothetical protein [Paenibacillus monticola]MRN56098.1 hypothetical protein [Paenibacillus monticola]
MKLKILFTMAIIIFLCSCGTKGATNAAVNGKDTDIPELNIVINNYFENFDDINNWSPYATDEFVRRVYSWCSSDTSETKSIKEMKSIYFEINKDSLKLIGYTIEEVQKESSDKVIIFVTREWENGQKDQTYYSFLKVKGKWKVDDRF